MKLSVRILAWLILAGAIAARGSTNVFHVQWFFADQQGSPLTNKTVYFTQLWTISESGTNLVPGYQRFFRTTSSNATITLSNLLAGGYRVEYAGPVSTISFTNVFGTNVFGLVNARDYIGASTNVNTTTTAYSQAAADARFYPLLTNPSNYLQIANAATTNSVAHTNDTRALNETNSQNQFAGSFTGKVTGTNASGSNAVFQGDSILGTFNGAGTITNAQIAAAIAAAVSNSFTLKTNGFNTNGTFANPTNFGPVTIKSPQAGSSPVLLGYSDNVTASINDFGNAGLEFHADYSNGGISLWISNQKYATLLPSTSDPIWRVTTVYNEQLGGAADHGVGANVSSYAPFVGGNGSALEALPPHGEEVWSAQPRPVIGMRLIFPDLSGTNIQHGRLYASQTNMQTVISNFNNSGITAALTNAPNGGVQPVVMLDTGWLQIHRSAAGRLVPDPTLWPNVTNSTFYAHTNGFEFWVNAYFWSKVPDNGNTELDLNVQGSGQFEYPGGSNSNGTNYIHPAITPDTVKLDLRTFYEWGVDGAGYQDVSANFGMAGYEFQRSRLIADAVLHPLANGGAWNSVYTNYFNHPLQTTLFHNRPHFPTLAYEANAFILDNFLTAAGDSNQGQLNSSPVSLAVAYSKSFYEELRMAPEKSIHATFLHSFGVNAMDTWGDHDFKAFLAGALIFRANILFQEPMANASYNTLAAVVTNQNSIFLSLFTDPAQRKPLRAVFNVTNSVWSRQLQDTSRTVVWLANESAATSTNLTVTWAQLGLATNTVVGVYDVWTNSYLGEATNSYTAAVPATNSLLRLFVARTGQTNLAGLVANNTPGSSNVISIGINTNILQVTPTNVIVADDNSNGSDGVKLAVRSPSGTPALLLGNPGSSEYEIQRNGGTGYLDFAGGQGSGATGISLQHTRTSSHSGTEFARITGSEGVVVTSGLKHYIGSVLWAAGSGSPEGAVTAPVGSLYSRTDGGAGTSLYVKETGAGNTGWVGK